MYGFEARHAEQVSRPCDEGVDVRLLVSALVRVWRNILAHIGAIASVSMAVTCEQGVGHGAHVVPLISVGREGHRLATRLQVAQPHADGENVHLPPGVVDVVLALHVEAGGLQQIGHRRAVGRVSTMADVQRPGRIG